MLKKFTKTIFVVVGLIGIISIPTAQAVQPYKHVTFGAVNALLEAGFTGGFLVRDLDNYCPVFDQGDEGRISVWYPGEYCVNDAHLMMVGFWFNTEDHTLALELYKQEKDGLVKTCFIMDGNYLETKVTPVKQWLGEIPPNSTYNWMYTVGVLFRQVEIPIANHSLTLSIELWIEDWGIYLPIFVWETWFLIVECWH